MGYYAPVPPGAEDHPPQPQPPEPAPEPEPEPMPIRDIDPDLIARGVTFTYATVPDGTGYWRVVKAEWLDEAEADAVGPDHHILGDIRKENNLAADIPMLITWPSGSTHIISKHDQNAAYNYDFPMTSSLNEFAITVADGNPSDKVSGIGMGKN